MEMQQDSDQESVGSKDSSVVSSRQSDSELQGVSGDEPEEIDDQDSENSDVSNSDADEDHNSLEEFPEIKDNANFNSNSVSRATNNSNSYENSESSGSEDEDNSGAESDANADANIHDNSQSYLAKSPPRKIVVPMSEKNIKKPRVTSGKGKARTVRKSSPDAGTTAKNGRAGVRARKSMDGDASSHARRRSSRPRTTKEHNSDASEDFSASEEEDDNSNYPAIKKYFLERLQQELMPLGAKKNELNAFRIRVTKKTSGLSTGLLEIKYCSHKNKKFKSRVEVGISLGVITAVRNIRNLKTEEHFMNSQEFREVVLISQKLAVQTLPIDSVSFVNDDIVFVSRERPADKEQTVNSINHKFFSCGNVTVLSWGKIVPFPAFHNPNHLFPVGFKCIRQEHDIRIDRVVDCLCEIDVENRNPTEKVTNERYTITEDSIPVFRLTISWKLRSGQNILRVYEARSAKLAWNAAMTEKVGIHETISHIKAKEVLMDGDMQVSGLSSDWFKKAHCSFDEEELSIRKSIRSKQTEFFKAIREEQKQGISGEMKPRLFLETTDSFTEDIILRMFEGMQNSYECEDYQFLDSREKDGGRKLIFKAYSRLISKMKALDKVIRKHAQAEDHMALVISKRTREEYFESRKKAKLENKEQKEKLMIIQRKKQSRIKELEKVISVMKSNLSKEVKRRREEAKLYVESLCDKENAELLTKDRSITSASSSALESLSNAMDVDKSGDDASKTSRPKPVNGPVLMDGNVFGKVLEIWEYLHTFAESLKIENIPSIDDFMTALRIHDSTCKQLADYSLPYQNTFGFAASSAGRNKTMTPFEAEQLLNKVGIMFAKTLMGEYEKIIGLDSVSAQIGSLRIPANEISWREITRVALLGAVCKEVGMSDADLAVMVKGRGYITTPEPADRKAIKLAKRRILFLYGIRDEMQETIYGFNAGLCMRLPAPCTPHDHQKGHWAVVLGLLKKVPNSCGWLIREIILCAANFAYDEGDSEEMREKILSCLDQEQWSVIDGSKAIVAALQLLEEANLPLAFATMLESSTTSISDAWKSQTECLTLCAKTDRKELLDGSGNEDDEDALYGNETEENKVDESEAVDNVVEIPTAEKGESNVIKTDEDAVEVASLSYAMQRCYIVVRDLMIHPSAEPFLFPVDETQLPAYYKIIVQPVSLQDIRSFLVKGNYSDSIYDFYNDVSILFENAMTYNAENSTTKTAAQKLLNVFDRLFYEIVLNWEQPLPYSDCCHGCRDEAPIAGGKAAICDRCDASYHPQCINSVASKSDWFCTACVEQYSVASVHPYKTAKVGHPDDSKVVGEVVGIEQRIEKLVFVVDFGGVREVWDGAKVREYTVQVSSDSTSTTVQMPSGYNMDDYDRVCGIAKCYTGWQCSRYIVPSVLTDEHNNAARKKSKINVTFDVNREALSILSPVAVPEDATMMEWITCLHALMQRTLNTPAVSSIFTQMEDDIDDTVVGALFAQVQESDRAVAFLQAKINNLKKDGDIEAKVDSKSGIIKAEVTKTNHSSDSKLLNGDVPDDKVSVVKEAESDDDFELFDENGECLTSVLEKRAETEEEWELRYLSRQKGKEDALLSYLLLHSALSDMESIIKDEEENGLKDPGSDASDIGGTSLSAIVKACAGKPTESLATEEWCRGWDAQMQSISRCIDFSSNGQEGICALCGTEESYLCSPLVWGQTLEDREKEEIEQAINAEQEAQNDTQNFPIESANGHLLRGFKAKSRALSGMIWQPIDTRDAAMEQSEGQRQKRKMKKGSIIAHECCASAMHAARDIIFGKKKEAEDQRIIEILLGIGRSKLAPLGYDRDGCFYYVFAGSPSLYITETVGKNSSSHLSAKSRALGKYITDVDIQWYGYHTQEEILQIIEWLNPHYPEEKILRRILVLLYSSAMRLTEEIVSDKSLVEPPDIRSSQEKEISKYVRPPKKLSADVDEEAEWDEEDVFQTDQGTNDELGSFPEKSVPRKSSFSATASDSEIDDEKINDAENDEGLGEDVNGVDQDLEARKRRGRRKGWRKEKIDKRNVKIEGALAFQALTCSMPKSIKAEVNFEANDYKKGEAVCVQSSKKSNLLWKAKILDKQVIKDGRILYKVRFDKWSAAYDNWFDSSDVHLLAPPNAPASSDRIPREELRVRREEYINQQAVDVPDILKTLNASKFYTEEDRIGGVMDVSTFSDTFRTIGALKMAMLLVEAALPLGAIDFSDDKWGNDFNLAWREAVIAASEPESLMQCQILLEYGIRTQWLKSQGSKLFSCLPSRLHALRNASFGAISIRLWVLDMAVRYDKVQYDQPVKKVAAPTPISKSNNKKK